MKEYKTLYFKDSKDKRKEMQAKIERLSAFGWQVQNTEAIDQGYGIPGALLFGLAGKRKAQVMIVLQRDRGGNYPSDPADAPTAQEIRREQQKTAINTVNTRAELMIDKVIPGYADFRKKYHK